jgi:hypothetical protein
VNQGHARTPVTILTSGVGLGVYVPALLNQRDLRAAGHDAEVEVLESFYTAPQLASHLAHRDAFRDNFKLALIANRMPRDVGADGPRIEALLARWAEQGRQRFIVWSGFWLSVLERYRARVPTLRLSVDLCRIDAQVSASFRGQRAHFEDEREIWLWNGAQHRLEWHIPVLSEGRPLAYEERSARLVVHGGGWAIGTFTHVLPELSRSGQAIDLLAPGSPSWPERRREDRHFEPDPEWHPWQRDRNGELSFPRLREVRSAREQGRDAEWLPNQHFPPAHSLVRAARAVVSKPGGGTLIDSLAAATPVVLLEPYGEAEARSGALWEELGFGIRYERWRELGFDPEVLARLHRNLLTADPRRTLAHYPVRGWT